jgi:signal transduction histidine kinase
MATGEENDSLSAGPEPAFARRSALVIPLLVECDPLGRVVWMSDRSRLALGDARYVMDALGFSMRYNRVLQDRGHLVIGLTPFDSAVEEEELHHLNGSMLRHYFRLEAAEHRLAARVRHMRKGGGALAVRQLEMERQRLGRELHTGVGQLLASIRLQLEIIGQQLPVPAPGVRLALERISMLAGSALEQVRSVSRRLHPPEWQSLTLESALRQLWEISGVAQRFQAVLDVQPLPIEPALETKILLYRAAQEGISNMARHARATRLEMTLAPNPERLVLTIRDNGIGFDARTIFSTPSGAGAGIGLRAIAEQAEAMGGKLTVESSPQGTTLNVDAPFEPAE